MQFRGYGYAEYVRRVVELVGKSEADLLHEAMGCIYYFNNVREHSSLGYRTPFAHLKAQLPNVDDYIRFVVPMILDKVSIQLGPWSGYYLLAQHDLGEKPGWRFLSIL